MSFLYSGFETDPYSQQAIKAASGAFTDVRRYSRDPFGRLFAEQGPSGFTPVGTDVHGDANLWSSLGGYGVLSSKVYEPFGGVTGATGTQSALGYQSDYTDPTTGDVNMGARWYNPSTATFRSRDTYAGKLGIPFSLNRYTYGLNNPSRYWDPTGRESYYLGALDFGGFDLSGLAASYGVSGPVEAVSYETANPSSGVYNYVVNNSDGTSQISTIAPTGIAISGPGGGTDRSGNLSYTPDDAVAIAAVELIDQGYSGQAIANAAEDAQKVAGARPSSTAIVSAAEGQGRILALVAPIAIPVGEAIHAGVVFCAATGAESVGVGCAAAAAAVAGIVVIAGIAYFVRKQPAAASALVGAAVSISGAGWISGIFVSRDKTGGSYGDTKGGTIFGEDAEGHHVVSKAAAAAAAFAAVLGGGPKRGCGPDAQPSVKMTKADHAKTASHPKVDGWKDFQSQQEFFAKAGDYRGAFELGIANIIDVTQGKYADGINRAYEYLEKFIKRCGGGGSGGSVVV